MQDNYSGGEPFLDFTTCAPSRAKAYNNTDAA